MRKKYFAQYNPSEESLELVYNLLYNKDAVIEYSELTMTPSPLNQEKEYMKKEAFEQLSKESREVINTILNCSAEVYAMITTKDFGICSMRTLRDYFMHKKKWAGRKVDKSFSEIIRYVNAM